MLAFVGCRNPQIGATFAQHSCFFKVDESVLVKGSMVAAQYAIDFLSEPTQEELDGPLVTRVAETNPQLAETLRGARSKTVGAHNALRDAREARVAAAREIREARHGCRRAQRLAGRTRSPSRRRTRDPRGAPRV